MTPTEPHDPLSHPEVRILNPRLSIVGYVLSVIFIVLSYFSVTYRLGSVESLYGLISGFAALTVLTQLFFWLRLGSAPHKWPTISLVLFLPFFILTIGLTTWMFATLYTRTMMPQLMP